MKRQLKELETKSAHEYSHNPEREARIAEAAYFKAEQRGFVPGHELDDWLLAERDITLSECSDCYSRQHNESQSKAA